MSISTIETTRTNDLLTISIPLKGLKTEDVDDLIALVKSSLIAQKSKMSEDDADKISEEINDNF